VLRGEYLKQYNAEMNFIKLIMAVGVSALAGVVGAMFTTPAIPTWYATLTMPLLTPPNWVFGPVWTTLYVLMGIALWLVWKDKAAAPEARRRALMLFFLQLALNVLWSYFFFGLQNPGLAAAEIILLWLSIRATMISFGNISHPAQLLLVPYMLWVSFATYLTIAIWLLN